MASVKFEAENLCVNTAALIFSNMNSQCFFVLTCFIIQGNYTSTLKSVLIHVKIGYCIKIIAPFCPGQYNESVKLNRIMDHKLWLRVMRLS